MKLIPSPRGLPSSSTTHANGPRFLVRDRGAFKYTALLESINKYLLFSLFNTLCSIRHLYLQSSNLHFGILCRHTTSCGVFSLSGHMNMIFGSTHTFSTALMHVDTAGVIENNKKMMSNLSK